MSDGQRPELTKVTFRRDVRWFLTILVGYLIVIIGALLVMVLETTGLAAERTTRQWHTVADVGAELLGRELEDGESGVSMLLTTLRTRYGVEAAEAHIGGRVFRSGVPVGMTPVMRRFPGGTLICYFDPTPTANARRTFMLVTIICVTASATGIILLLLYLPKITRPVELLLEEAAAIGQRPAGQDETGYLVETFRATVIAMKAQEEELRHLHEVQKMRADDLERVTTALTRSLASGFFSIGPDGRMVAVNTAASDILELPQSAVGLTIIEAFGANDFSARVKEAFERRQAVARAEATVVTTVGTRVIGLTTVPLLNERQEFLGMLGLFTDLTPLRELEHRVREMQNLADLGEISAGIAHEFRNSLSTIGGYLRLSHRGSSREESLAAVEKAEREASALARAVTSLLTYARPMEIETQPVELLSLTETVVDRLRTDTGGAITCGGDTAIIEGDAALLDRAIENVIRNAVQSVQRKQNGGRVDVQIATGRSVSLTVTDDGLGVDPAEVPTLFLPFRSTNPDGYGLGLPLAKKIVLLHGGTLRLTGQPGQGATAVMEFTPATRMS